MCDNHFTSPRGLAKVTRYSKVGDSARAGVVKASSFLDCPPPLPDVLGLGSWERDVLRFFSSLSGCSWDISEGNYAFEEIKGMDWFWSRIMLPVFLGRAQADIKSCGQEDSVSKEWDTKAGIYYHDSLGGGVNGAHHLKAISSILCKNVFFLRGQK